MPNTQVTLGALQAMMAEHTDVVFLHALTIDHPLLEDGPLRFVDNPEPVERSAGTFEPAYFNLTLPADDEERLPQVRLVIDNVARELMAEIRKAATSPTCTLEVIASTDWEVAQYGPLDFTFKSVEYDVMEIQITMGFHEILNRNYPALFFLPHNAPGLW